MKYKVTTPMFYSVNMAGCKPSYYTEEDWKKALAVFFYLKTNVTKHVSLRRVSWQKIIKDGICRDLN